MPLLFSMTPIACVLQEFGIAGMVDFLMLGAWFGPGGDPGWEGPPGAPGTLS